MISTFKLISIHRNKVMHFKIVFIVCIKLYCQCMKTAPGFSQYQNYCPNSAACRIRAALLFCYSSAQQRSSANLRIFEAFAKRVTVSPCTTTSVGAWQIL